MNPALLWLITPAAILAALLATAVAVILITMNGGRRRG